MEPSNVESTEVSTRTRKLTEKGAELRLTQLQRHKKQIQTGINDEFKALEDGIESNRDGNELLSTFKKIQELMNSLQENHKETMSLVKDTEIKEQETSQFNVFLEKHKIFENKLQSMFKKPSTSAQVVEEDVEEFVAASSSLPSSDLKLRRAEAAAKKAALEVESDFTARQKSIYSRMQRMQEEFDHLEERKNIAIAGAKEAAYARVDEEEPLSDPLFRNPSYMPVIRQTWFPTPFTYQEDILEVESQIEEENHVGQQSHDHSKKESMIPQPPTRPPSIASDICSSGASVNAENRLYQILEKLVEIQRGNHLPTEEPEVFDGNIMDFPIWLRDFEDLIESNITSSSRRIRLLSKYTAGDAKSCIKGLLGLKTKEAYKEAKETLVEWFGSVSDITRKYKEKLQNWPFIQLKDGGVALRDFSHFLHQCEALTKDSGFALSLDDEDLNQTLISKMPKGIRDRWSRKVLDYQTRYHSFPKFAQFCGFIKYEAKLATLPVVGTAVLDKFVDERKPSNTRNPKSTARTRPMKTFATVTNTTLCIYCSNDDHKSEHDLPTCPVFSKIAYDSRVSFIKKHGICFGCLNVGHLSKDCSKRLCCEVCNKSHPTVLHRMNFKKPVMEKVMIDRSVTTNHATSQVHEIKTTRIIPVKVSSNGNHQDIETYVVLDEQSDTSYISEELASALKIQGIPVRFKLSTVTSCEIVDSVKFENLQVKNVKTGNVVQLSSCYSREHISVDRDQILRTNSLKRLSKFSQIANEVMDYSPHLNVGMLLGTNCIKSMEPEKVIYDKVNHCYAIKSMLGWSTVGIPNILSESKNHHTCHRISLVNVDNKVRTKKIFSSS